MENMGNTAGTENIVTSPDGATDTTTGQEGQDKTFSQAELDEIVQARLARERKRLNDMINEDAGIRQELLTSRLQLEMAKKLTEKGLSHSLLDLLDYTSKDNCNESFEKVLGVFKAFRQDVMDEIYKTNGRTPERGSYNHGSSPVDKDPLKDAFHAK